MVKYEKIKEKEVGEPKSGSYMFYMEIMNYCLNDLRNMIDEIDTEIIRLVADRLKVVSKIADYKQSHQLPVYDSKREEDKLKMVREMAGDEYGEYMSKLYSSIFEISRDYQEHIKDNESYQDEIIKKRL